MCIKGENSDYLQKPYQPCQEMLLFIDTTLASVLHSVTYFSVKELNDTITLQISVTTEEFEQWYVQQ